MQRKIENEEQLIAFCEEQIAWLKEFSKDRNKFLKENLTEDEIREYNVVIKDDN
jgi:hypothetical protein